jgi:hypothetical protein
MRFKNTDNGVAGLTILLSLVTMLFVIGLLVMIFALMGGELQEATYDANTSNTVTLEQVTGSINGSGTGAVTNAGALNFGWSVTNVTNATENAVISSSYYTVNTDGTLTNATAWYQTVENVNISYTWDYDMPSTASEVMNDTVTGISGTTDWFAIFIVIGAMVVLILLTVIIITAIRGSGLIAGGSADLVNCDNYYSNKRIRIDSRWICIKRGRCKDWMKFNFFFFLFFL